MKYKYTKKENCLTDNQENDYKIIQDNDEILKALKKGESIAHWEFGGSMEPVLHNKEYCVIVPLKKNELSKIHSGDAVFCRVNGYLMVHMVWLVSNVANKPYFLIGSSSGSLYGWTSEVYGKAFGTRVIENVKEEDD